MLNSELLLSFADTFYGYGDLSAPIWFIGMEEGGGSEENIRKRLETWDERGRRRVEDLARYHEAMGVANLTTGRGIRLQPTWAKLIHFQLAAENAPRENSSVKSFQGSVWGRDNSRTCLLKLMPLPKRNASEWPYKEWTEEPELWSRSLYFAHFAAKRAAALRALVEGHKPKVVVFYGKSREFACHWPWIARVRPSDWLADSVWPETKRDGTQFMIAPHPVAHGSQNAVWAVMGERVSGLVDVDRASRYSR